MKDIDILTQILNGYYLNPNELKRAKELNKKIALYIKQNYKN